MMLRLVFFSWIFLGTSFSPALAEVKPANSEHLRSAFVFAERKQWRDASLHADRSGEPAMERLVQWLSYHDAESGATFDEITSFLEKHPSWPQRRRLMARAEQAIFKAHAADSDIIAWFEKHAPVTGSGKLALGEARQRSALGVDESNYRQLIREGWIEGDFDKNDRERILQQHAAILEAEDHTKRASRLLFEDKVSAAEELLPLLDEKQKLVMKARIALIRGDKHAAQAVAHVPSSLKEDQGLLFDRLRYRAKKDDDEAVREILLMLEEPPQYPEKWWDYRERQVREAIDEENYKLAARLLKHHGLTEGPDYVDASWLEGWLKLEFLKRPAEARRIFETMYENVRFPVSRARAAYWSGRAAEAERDASDAQAWYERASSYPTAFYGQLASLKAHGHAPLRFPSQPRISSSEQAAFERKELPRAVLLSIRAGRHDLASRLLTSIIEETDSKEDAAMMALIGQSAGQPHLSVRSAKKALQFHNAVLLNAGYPIPDTPEKIAVERPLLLAITRQESEFDADAKSPANAMGMMQVLPGTAKETARKNALGYHVARLYEPDYSWIIGSLYLSRMINHYDGSYILAIASYNAGPGNVRRWVNEFGRPGDDIESAVQWIEKIPFRETRNYVQRVLENLQVYRHLLAQKETPKLKLGDDLTR